MLQDSHFVISQVAWAGTVLTDTLTRLGLDVSITFGTNVVS